MGWGLVASLVGLLGSVAGLGLALQTDVGSRWVWQQAQGLIEKTTNIRMDVQEAELKPFSSLKLKKVRIVRPSGDVSFEISVEALEVEFQFSWKSKKLDIARVGVEHPRVRAVFRSAEARGGSFLELPDPFPVPGVELAIRQIQVKDLEGEFEWPSDRRVVRIEPAHLRFNADWTSAELRAEMDAGFSQVAVQNPGSGL